MATCLVTGGAGFLGSHLCDELLARGNRVICVDNFETGSLANIEHIRDPERFVHFGVDIIEPYFVDEPIDFVYHLASPASPIDYLRLPLHTLKVGSYGTHHTLGLAKAKRARFLIASTSEVYGDPLEHPQSETLLGARQPDRPARRLRRGQALRGGADDGLPPPAGRGHGDRADLQHLRHAHAPARRPRDPDVPAPGARQPADHRLRRRQPDALLLLRQRPDPRDHRAGGVRPPRPREHRQPRRVHAARTGRDGQRADRLELGDRLRGAARGRPQAAQARHRARARAARLVARGVAARGSAAHDRGVRRRAADRWRHRTERPLRGLPDREPLMCESEVL